ncbi:MAG: hypothetical protein LKJ88_02135 [Bacilli bacterium]|jgi:hypothetical protein|nr:hypothetical protein [Bacilli bacterium]
MKNYFTRKNLIGIALAAAFYFLMLFTGLCLDGSFIFLSKDNPIALMATSIGFVLVEPKINGFIFMSLVGLYLVVFVAAIIYEVRFAVTTKKNPNDWRMWLVYLATLVICLLLSFGVGFLFQLPFNAESVKNVFSYLWQCLACTAIIYFFAFIIVAAGVMLVVNLVKIDKPFKVDNKTPDLGDEPDTETNVAQSFGDVAPVLSQGGIAGGEGGAIVASATPDEEKEAAVKLDDREKVFPTLSSIDSKYQGYTVEKVDADEITLKKLCDDFRNWLAKEQKLYFTPGVIRAFIAGFSSSRLLILEGLSGTGKSSLPRYFAEFISAKVTFVSVQATWRDKTSVIGYFNSFSNSYQETEFLSNLYEASYDPDRVNLFVLDEMNISRIEYYFADFLSVLEFPSSEWKIKLMNMPYDFLPPAHLENGCVRIPTNSYFIGTANKDDSTFSITNKVYDRAVTIDFAERNEPFTVDEKVKPVVLSETKLNALFEEALQTKNNSLSNKELDDFQEVCDYIKDEFDVTYGNRILNQMLTFVPVYVSCGGSKDEALDFILAGKVLTKLEGRFEDYVKDGLNHLLALIEKKYGKGVFALSEAELNSLIRKL